MTLETRATSRNNGSENDSSPKRAHAASRPERSLGKAAMAIVAAAGITIGAVGIEAIYKGIQRDLHIGLPNVHLPKTGPTPAVGKAVVAEETYKSITLKTPVCPDTIEVDAGVRTNSNYKVLGLTSGGSGANALLPVLFNACAKDALAVSAVVESKDGNVQNIQITLPANYVPQSAGPDVLSDVMCLGLPADATAKQIEKAQAGYDKAVTKHQQPCANNLIETHGITGIATNSEAFNTTLLALRLATLAGQLTPLPEAQFSQWQTDQKDFYLAAVNGLYPNLSPSAVTFNIPASETPAQQLASNLSSVLPELRSDFAKMHFESDNNNKKTDFVVSTPNASGEVVMPDRLSPPAIAALNGML